MPHIPRRHPSLILALALVALPLVMATPTAASSDPSLEGTPAEGFANAVATLGQTTYPQTYAGATLTPSAMVDVYATPTNDSVFVAAVAALDSTNTPYTFVPVSLSFDALESITSQIAASSAQLSTDGVSLDGWGPNPSAGVVDVTVVPPAAEQLQALGQVLGSPDRLTLSTYGSSVAALISQIAGTTAISVSVVAGPIPQAFLRTGDTSPFWGGDTIYNLSQGKLCTSGFGVIGNASGHEFTLTAGHCLSGSYYTTQSGSIFMGNSSSLYWLNNATSDDFQTIGASTQGYVWGNGGASYNVIGQIIPAVGADITFDGSVTGEVRGVPVKSVGSCQIFGTQFGSEKVCHMVEGASGGTICQGGDSGGPMYQHTTGSEYAPVNAVATIVGGTSTDCFGEEIGQEESVSNTYLEIT